jgi:hypothetical protein
MLGPEDQVVQLAVHAQKHGFERLIWLKDIDLLLRAYDGRLDWTLIGRIAEREGVRGPVWYALAFARRMLATPVPPAVLNDIRPMSPVRVLYRLVWPPARIEALQGHMRRRAVQFHAADSLRGMAPALLLLGRRRDRATAALQTTRVGRGIWRNAPPEGTSARDRDVVAAGPGISTGSAP